MGKQIEIRFIVAVAGVKTMADGGIRYTFDGSESDIEAAASIIAVKGAGNALELIAKIIPNVKKENHAEETDNGTGGSSRKTRRYPYHS